MRIPYYQLIFAVAFIKPIDSLICSSCQHIDDPRTCNTTTSCSDNEVCYLHAQGGIYSMGCADNQHCGGVGGLGLVGRTVNEQRDSGPSFSKRQQLDCQECCSSDSCNTDLCKHLKPTQCVDDETVDCAKLNSLFHVCTSDEQQASLVCPKFCNLCTMVNGNWTLWSSWSSCDVTCGNGTETRSRSCSNPSPAHGGRDCVGSKMESKTCRKELCPVHGGWSTWSQWGSCSVTCDIGLQRRDRSCSNPYPNRLGDHCFGESRDDRMCTPGACFDGGWGSWSGWSSCSETCGGGTRLKTRTCTNPKPSLVGKQCEGLNFQVSLCNKQTCPEHKISFTAYGISGTGSSTLIFSQYYQNLGYDYRTSTGKFTCAVPGIYYFSVQISKKHADSYPTDRVSCYMYLNSVKKLGVIQDPHEDTNTGNDKSGYSISLSGTFHLNTGDTVYIGGCAGINSNTIYTDNRSSFTGFLVTPDN